MTPGQTNQACHAAMVESLLALSPPRFFTALGNQDWYSSSHEEWIDDQRFAAGDRILEVGCATGTLAAYMADNGYNVVGIDHSSAMIDMAKQAHPDLDFHVGVATALTFDDSTFDAVVSASVINVASDPLAILTEMRRVCVPGGTVTNLVPAAGFTDRDLHTLITKRRLTGFSKAAITKWHQSGPKKRVAELDSLLRNISPEQAIVRSYLDGMLVGATVTV